MCCPKIFFWTKQKTITPLQVKWSFPYNLQSNRAKFNSGYVSPLCKLCNENNEELSHFSLYCPFLENEGKQLLSQITEQCLVLCNNFNIKTVPDLLCVIANPYHLLEHCSFSQCRELCCFIDSHIEPACRALIYRLHTKGYNALEKKQTMLRKNNL